MQKVGFEIIAKKLTRTKFKCLIHWAAPFSFPCKEVPHHAKAAIRPSLPNDMLVCPEHVETRLLGADSARNKAQLKEFVISLV